MGAHSAGGPRERRNDLLRPKNGCSPFLGRARYGAGVVRARMDACTQQWTVAPRTVRVRGRACVLLFFTLVTAVVALGGCGGTTIASSRGVLSSRSMEVSPTSVALHLNARSYSLSGSSTTISGTVTRGAKVTVNGRRVLVHAGHWSRSLHLRFGKNRIAVKATLRGHPASRQTITVTREESPAELEAETPAIAPTQEPEGGERQPTPTTAPATSPQETCTNGTYVNSAGNTVCRPEQSPTAPAGATAECEDGTYSFSQSRSGTCSHHGGVARWL